MGAAYFLQFLDKLSLSQATLFNLRQDLVKHPLFLIYPKTDRIEPSWLAIFLDIGDLLLWILLLELAKFLRDCSHAYWEIFVSCCVRLPLYYRSYRKHPLTRQLFLGWYFNVPCCMH